jgi:photosystem II stability/assembly factor-like uncharacterized protein
MNTRGRGARRWVWLTLLLLTSSCTREPAAPRVAVTATPTPVADGRPFASDTARDVPQAMPVPTQTAVPVDWREVAALSFADALHGWALGIRTRTADRCEQALWRTVDGGRTWELLPYPFAPAARCTARPTGAHDVSQLLFTSPLDGWAFGPGRYVTHDGGLSWREETGTQPTVTLARAGTQLWVVEGSCPGNGDICPLVYRISSDQGESWQPAPVPPAIRGPNLTLHWADAQHGWLLSYGMREPSRPFPGGLTTMSHARLLATEDGGHSWERRPAPCRDFGVYSVDLAADGHGRLWLLCGGQPSAGMQLRRLFRSEDGGRNWNAPLGVSGSGYITSFTAPSTRVAFVGHRRGTLVRTRDGGQTWDYPYPVNPLDQGLPLVTFVDEQYGWVVYPRTGVIRTEDGGDHWELVPLP